MIESPSLDTALIHTPHTANSTVSLSLVGRVKELQSGRGRGGGGGGQEIMLAESPPLEAQPAGQGDDEDLEYMHSMEVHTAYSL